MRVKDVEGYEYGLAWLQRCNEQLNKLRDEGYNTYNFVVKLNSVLGTLAGLGEAELCIIVNRDKDEQRRQREIEREEQRRQREIEREKQRKQKEIEREEHKENRKKQKAEQQREDARLNEWVNPPQINRTFRMAEEQRWEWEDIAEYLRSNNVHDKDIHDMYEQYWETR